MAGTSSWGDCSPDYSLGGGHLGKGLALLLFLVPTQAAEKLLLLHQQLLESVPRGRAIKGQQIHIN